MNQRRILIVDDEEPVVRLFFGVSHPKGISNVHSSQRTRCVAFMQEVGARSCADRL